MEDSAETSLSLRVGVLSDSTLRAQRIRQAVTLEGYAEPLMVLAAEFSVAHMDRVHEQVDVWLVDVELGLPPFLEDWLTTTDCPVIWGEQLDCQGPEFNDWLRRVIQKLPHLAGMIRLQQSGKSIGREIWVLAASTGGPEAVKQFLQALKPELGIAFLYVQHIDAGFEHNLLRSLRSLAYQPFLAGHGDILAANSVAIVPSDRVVEVLENGTLLMKAVPWAGRYAPSVDEVLANVARRFRGRCGAIIFSGMGDDGTAGSRLMHQCGGQIWVQSPSSCTIGSMPESVMKTTPVVGMGTPLELARRLTQVWQTEAS